MEAKRILITGASGFLGGYFVEAALEAGLDVWVAIRETSSRERLQDKRIHFVEIDYSDIQSITSLAEHLAPNDKEPAWHYIIHNAGATKVNKRADFELINANYTKNLLTGLSLANQAIERFVLISSLGSYGPTAQVGKPLRATDPQRPNTAYGKSKLLAERYVEECSLPYTILLLTGVYGPYDTDYLVSIKAIARGIDALSGCKPQTLTFVYASDVAKAVLFVLDKEETNRRRFFLSDGNTYTDIEYGRLVESHFTDRKVRHRRMPLPIVWLGCFFGKIWGAISGKPRALNLDKYRIIAQRSWACDDTPIRELGFRSEIELAEGIKRTIKWANDKGYL